jgi:hypothetical protein
MPASSCEILLRKARVVVAGTPFVATHHIALDRDRWRRRPPRLGQFGGCPLTMGDTLDESDFADLLQHVRSAVRVQLGRADLDTLLVSSRLQDAPTNYHRLLAYLTGLQDEMTLGTERVERQIMRRFDDIRTENGGPISGITVDVAESDTAVYGSESINLIGSPELDFIVREFDELIGQLRESRDQ